MISSASSRQSFIRSAAVVLALVGAGCAASAFAEHGRGMLLDGRYHHDHYYPQRGVAIGVVLPFLPDFYTTVWFGGVPYYYANDTYYLWNRDSRGYVVTQPPADVDAATPPDPDSAAPAGTAGDDFFMYPRNNQSAEDQARDRFECHQWAVTQTGFDPSEPGGGVPPAQNSAKRSDYRRAITACLEGRQYSVK